jgi:phosphatidylserine decarboxylase
MRFQTLFEGRWIFAFLLALTALSGWLAHRSGNPLWYVLLAIALLLILFCLNFFRDPQRTPPDDPLAILAAADGVVADITEVEESEVLLRRVKRIGIFLNVFNVHVNKAPIDAKITYFQHHPGLYLDARHSEATTKNEALTWGFEGARATLVVRQITGAIARRIVPWSKLGDTIPRGFRFGMIRFGSRTEVFVPLDCEVLVQIGDSVKGGLDIIARFPPEPAP